MGRDAAEVALEILQADTTLLALVTDGATNILDSGDMRMQTLSESEEARRDASGTGVLGISVQDAGEAQVRGDLYNQTVIVRVLDRNQSFNAIRTARFAIYDALQHKTAKLSGDQGGLVSFRYNGRSGHRVDRTYTLHFEAINFIATVQRTEV